MATISKFGNGGTRTVRENKPAVVLGRAKDEYVSYQVQVSGAAAAFALSNTQRTIKQANTFPGHPLQTYEWTLREADLPDDDETYVLSFAFPAAVQYTVIVKHHRSDNSVIETHKDLDLTTTDPTDEFRDPLRILLV
jgi:hypothetical protein